MFRNLDSGGVRVAHLFGFLCVCVCVCVSPFFLFVLCLGRTMLPMTPDYYFGPL